MATNDIIESMRAILNLCVLSISILSACSMQSVESQKRTENPQSEITNSQLKQAVLVELFTSEG